MRLATSVCAPGLAAVYPAGHLPYHRILTIRCLSLLLHLLPAAALQYGGHRIRSFDLTARVMITLVGDGTAGNAGDGGPPYNLATYAMTSQVNHPSGLAFKSTSNTLFFGELQVSSLILYVQTPNAAPMLHYTQLHIKARKLVQHPHIVWSYEQYSQSSLDACTSSQTCCVIPAGTLLCTHDDASLGSTKLVHAEAHSLSLCPADCTQAPLVRQISGGTL